MTTTCTMILGDCLEVMPALSKNINFVFADIPYGVLSVAWDKRLPLPDLWNGINLVKHSQSVVCLMATNPYASDVIASNRSNFSYDLIWVKGRGTGAFQAARRPMRAHEIMLIFYGKKGSYAPQMRKTNRARRGTISKPEYATSVFGRISASSYTYGDYVYPLSWQHHNQEHARKKIHSSQKPIALMDWLICSYCNTGEHVLDPVSGSGATAVSAIQNGRNVTCIEKDEGYFDASVERVKKVIVDGNLDAKLEVRR